MEDWSKKTQELLAAATAELAKVKDAAELEQYRIGYLGSNGKLKAAMDWKVRKNIKLGICGEHGGDPASVAFCHEIGLDYVSCSPYRVPIARLAAAKAALAERGVAVEAD